MTDRRDGTIAGCLAQWPGDDHVVLREHAFRRALWYDEPAGVRIDVDAGRPRVHRRMAAELLDEFGVAVLQFDRALSSCELVEFANFFGDPLPQPNPRTAPWVEDRVILDLRADFSETDDLEWRLLFAENYVMAHTEMAAKPLSKQPRWIVLQCVEPPLPDAGGQTVLVAGVRVHGRLDVRTLRTLAGTRQLGEWNVPPILRRRAGIPAFSFRDPGGTAPIRWRFREPGGPDGPRVELADVDGALRALLKALYEPQGLAGIRWTQHAVAIFDNTRFFHARTFVRRHIGPARHLRRIRILDRPVRPELRLAGHATTGAGE
jgi:alpha-ketoglutarate-dependent taurine dioxygenase